MICHENVVNVAFFFFFIVKYEPIEFSHDLTLHSIIIGGGSTNWAIAHRSKVTSSPQYFYL